MLTGCPCSAGQTGERPIIGGGKGRQRLLAGRAPVAAELWVALGVPLAPAPRGLPQPLALPVLLFPDL